MSRAIDKMVLKLDQVAVWLKHLLPCVLSVLNNTQGDSFQWCARRRGQGGDSFQWRAQRRGQGAKPHHFCRSFWGKLKGPVEEKSRSLGEIKKKNEGKEEKDYPELLQIPKCVIQNDSTTCGKLILSDHYKGVGQNQV